MMKRSSLKFGKTTPVAFHPNDSRSSVVQHDYGSGPRQCGKNCQPFTYIRLQPIVTESVVGVRPLGVG